MGYRLPGFNGLTIRSTCVGEIRNCRAMAAGLTPASNAVWISLSWPAERPGGGLPALGFGLALRLGGDAFPGRERSGIVVVGRGRRRRASALTARDRISSWVSSRCFSEAGKSHGNGNGVGVLSPPVSSGGALCGGAGFAPVSRDENRSGVSGLCRWRRMKSGMFGFAASATIRARVGGLNGCMPLHDFLATLSIRSLGIPVTSRPWRRRPSARSTRTGPDRGGSWSVWRIIVVEPHGGLTYINTFGSLHPKCGTMYFGSGGSDPMRSHDIPRYPINIAPDPMKSHPTSVLNMSTFCRDHPKNAGDHGIRWDGAALRAHTPRLSSRWA